MVDDFRDGHLERLRSIALAASQMPESNSMLTMRALTRCLFTAMNPGRVPQMCIVVHWAAAVLPAALVPVFYPLRDREFKSVDIDQRPPHCPRLGNA